jgi:hypothetical protein
MQQQQQQHQQLLLRSWWALLEASVYLPQVQHIGEALQERTVAVENAYKALLPCWNPVQFGMWISS